jgi:hypothetical protein
MTALKRTIVSYGVLRKQCLDAIRHWPGCETVAGIQLVRANSPSGFSLKVTLYGNAETRRADKAAAFVERQMGREFYLADWSFAQTRKDAGGKKNPPLVPIRIHLCKIGLSPSEGNVMKLIVAAICTAAVIGQISTACAQYPAHGYYYYYPPGSYYYWGSPSGLYNVLTPQDLGWNYTRNQPVGYSKPYPALRMPDGTLACEHSNRPIRGWCQQVCCGRPDSP